MGNIGGWFGKISGSAGGGGADLPFTLATAKIRQFNKTGPEFTIPAGALIVEVHDLGTGIPSSATIQIGSGPVDHIGPGLKLNYENQLNFINKTQQLAPALKVTPAPGEAVKVFVAYPENSSVDVNTI
jgi:hypothetical protein